MLLYTRKDGQPVFLPTDSGLFPRYKAAIFYPYIIIFLSQILFFARRSTLTAGKPLFGGGRQVGVGTTG